MVKVSTKLTTDMARYKRNYRLRNPEKFRREVKCDICAGKYQVCSKNQHMKTDKHKTGIHIREMESKIEELEEKLNNLCVDDSDD